MTPVPFDLLRDLAALVRKHPAKDWLGLAALLEDDQTRRQLISVLQEAGALAESGPSERRKTTLAKRRMKRAATLDSRERFELDLSRSPIGELRSLARRYGIPFSGKDSRQRLRNRLVVSVRRGDIKTNSEGLADKGQGDYAKWADIIIRGRPRR
jgi:hypothetical protein